MATYRKFSRPIMRGTAGLDPDKASRQAIEECQHAPTGQLPGNENLARRTHALDLKHVAI